jgi:hypothetical protein
VGCVASGFLGGGLCPPPRVVDFTGSEQRAVVKKKLGRERQVAEGIGRQASKRRGQQGGSIPQNTEGIAGRETPIPRCFPPAKNRYPRHFRPPCGRGLKGVTKVVQEETGKMG